jgi:hypothetical protein
LQHFAKWKLCFQDHNCFRETLAQWRGGAATPTGYEILIQKLVESWNLTKGYEIPV